ncbi:MAG: hypothetical protein EZS28_004172 [Streblomastix strix]|uniref:Uncharacterized protein n=1 Tax=Streblomastix strix TaxID=222440 RepID=A0A5J4WZE7_9EUKA|nr:MAG: hypothetical protein EZS28_004172 [Streblomastix strix]
MHDQDYNVPELAQNEDMDDETTTTSTSSSTESLSSNSLGSHDTYCLDTEGNTEISYYQSHSYSSSQYSSSSSQHTSSQSDSSTLPKVRSYSDYKEVGIEKKWMKPFQGRERDRDKEKQRRLWKKFERKQQRQLAKQLEKERVIKEEAMHRVSMKIRRDHIVQKRERHVRRRRIRRVRRIVVQIERRTDGTIITAMIAAFADEEYTNGLRKNIIALYNILRRLSKMRAQKQLRKPHELSAACVEYLEDEGAIDEMDKLSFHSNNDLSRKAKKICRRIT